MIHVIFKGFFKCGDLKTRPTSIDASEDALQSRDLYIQIYIYRPYLLHIINRILVFFT